MGHQTFKPGSKLTFDTVMDNRKKVLNVILSSQSGILHMDLSGVTRCDSAGLAFLLHVKKLCLAEGKQFTMTGLSQETEDLAEFCGVKTLLTNEK